MRRALLLAIGILALPVVGEAQIELGMDAGATLVRSGGESATTFGLPLGSLRIGFPRESFTIESRLRVNIVNVSDVTLTVIRFAPGVLFPVGSNLYVRGEVVLDFLSGGSGSVNQLGFGGAVGTQRQIGDGPVSLRFEGSVDQFLENDDFPSNTEFSVLVGISVLVN